MLHLPSTRWHAFAIHLMISLVIFIFLLFIITQLWYPGAFMQLGGWQGVKIAAGVDMVLGPLLTLIVYNRAKKELKFDLFIIALIQLSCLTAGMWLVYQERPLVQVFSDSEVHISAENDLLLFDISKQDIDKLPGSYPKKIYLELPMNMESIITLGAISEVAKGKPLYMDSELFRPLTAEKTDNFLWRYELLEKHKTLNCRWAELDSKYLLAQACLSLDDGILEIKPTDPDNK